MKTVRMADGNGAQVEAVAGPGCLSADDPRVHFGLGAAAKVDRVITVEEK